ncbi:unnamed protein product [Lampetra planeri]
MNPGQSEVYIENKVLLPHDERERVQKKTFTKWVNSHLVKSKRQVNDLYEDLRDGHNLISLLELLSGEMLPRERGSMLVHKMQNIKIALDFMQRRQIKLVNIRSDDIAEGNPKLTLGLIWTIILHFQVSDIQVGEQHRDLGAKERLLLWVRRVVQEYPDLRCDNFTTSWRDGRLFNAIIHRHRPDLLDMKKVYQQNNQQNLEQAFSLAEQNLRVPRLLDTEDVDVKSPEEKSVVTYVAALYEAFPKIPADGITIYEVDKKWKEYETKISFLLSWIKEKMQKVESQGSTMSQEELKILLLQLKEKDIPGRDGEKASIEKLYKAFQVWINFGRIKVAPGQSPADVEKELGKLVKVIQAGEMKAQQEASRAKAKAEQEAKEKAKAEAAAKEAQAKEAEAKAKAQEEARAKAKAEALAKAQEEEKVRLIAQQQTKVRFQADAAAKALADSIAKQQEEARAKEAEAKESEAVKAKEAEEARLRAEAEARALAESLSKAQAEAKAEAEADQKLNFIKDLMALMEEKQMEIESADWGIDLSSVGANLQSHKNLHQVLEALNTKVVEAQAYESKVPASRKKNYTDSLAALTATYNKSLAASGARSTRLQELLAFLAPAEAELAWAKGQETEQLERDWSDKNADMEAQRKSLDASQKKLNEKQPIFADIKKLGEKLLSDKHPAKSTIEASLEGIGAQWAWLTQLGACGETHLQENAAYFQFFRDVDDTGKELSAARDSLNQAYACDASTDVPRLESLLQQTHTEQRLVPLRGKVHELVGRSQSVLNLKPRRPGHTLKDPVTVMAITDYTQPEVTVKKDQEYELKDNSDATRWRVASVGRKDATVPSVCFVLPSPNPDALQAAERLRQQHKDILAAWNGKTADLRSLLAWHHLLQYTKIIRAWDLPTLKKLALGQKEEALKELERRRQAFLEERATSQAPGDAETAQAEAEVSTCKQHYYIYILQFLQQKEKERKKKEITFSGLRQEVTLEELVESEIIDENTAGQLIEGTKSVTDVSPSIEQYLGGGRSIAGLYVEATKEKMPIDVAIKKNLLTLGTGMVLLEAQAATGSMIDPLNNTKLSVDEAVQKGLVSPEYQEKLKLAERAVTGYTDPITKKTISLFEAMEKEIILKQHGIRILEAQIATGGIIDPQNSHRLPIEVAYKRGLFDKKLHATLLDPTVGVPQKEGPHISSEELAVENLKKTTLDLPFGSLAGKKYTLQEIFDGDLIDKHKKDQLMRDYKSGKISLEELMIFIIEIIRLKEREKTKKSITFHGIRTDVTVDELVRSGLLKEDVANQLADGLITQDEVQKQVGGYLGGSSAIAGLYVEGTKETISLYDGFKRNLIKTGTGLVLLEAQAASGFIIDPVKNEKLSVEEAVQKGVVGPEYKDKLLSAERAVTGYKDKFSGATFSVFQAMQNKQILKQHGIRLLEAQIATGGIIDPQASHRLPVEAAYKRGLFDEEMNQILSDPSDDTKGFFDPNTEENLTYMEQMQRCIIDPVTGLTLLPIKEKKGKKAEKKVPTQKEAIERLKKTTVDLPFGKFAGKKYTLQDIFDSDLVDEDKKKQLMIDYKTGKITLEQLMLLIIEIIRLNEREKTKKAITFHGIRTDVTVDNLVKSGVLKEDVANQLADGLITKDDVQKQVRKYLGGSNAIAGLYIEKTKEKMSLYDGLKKKLIKPGTGLVLLEAQAASGFIIDPVKDQKLSVEEAVQKGVVGKEYQAKLLSAERAVTGYKDPFSKETLSLFQAMKKELILQAHGIRLLEAQIATGGIIDPQASHRLPVEVAYKRGLFDEEMNQILSDPSDDTKGFFDPNTEENLTYMEQMQRCIIDPDTGLTLLPIKEKKGKRPEKKVPTQKEAIERLKKTTVDLPFGKFAGKKYTLQDIFDSDLVEEDKKKQLMIDYKTGKITLEQLMLLIIEIIRLNEREKTKKAITFHGIRTDVTVDNLVKSGVLKEDVANQLADGLITKDDVQKQVRKYLGGSNAIAGLYIEKTKEKMSLYDGLKKKLIKLGTGLVLLEAQAASGFIIDPVKDQKLSVEEAVQKGVVGEEYQDKLLSAERAVTGYKDPFSKETLSLFQAMKKELILKAHGIRLLEAQIATGGIIDPQASHRLPVEAAYKRGLFDEEMNQILSDPSDDTKGFFDPNTEENLTYMEQMQRCIIDPDTGLTLLPIKEKKGKRPEKKSPITFKGFRRQVTISELMDSGLINETTASKLNDGSVSVNEVSESLKVFLEGTSSIAGVFVDRTKEILSIYAAMKRGLIRPGTAFELLEAQAATGYIIDPVKKQKLLVEEAIKLGVVGEEFKDKLLSAERAVTGYKDPYTDQKISIFQAMKKQMIVKNHGIRLLEAQIATGGIIDPHASHRIPVELAYKRGLFDEEMNQILLDPSDDTKGFFDPNTEENLTYMELLQRCSKDSSGLYLLMLKDKKPERKMSSKSSVRKRKIIVVDPDTGKEMTVYEAYMKGLIDQPTYLQLSAQESEWEEITITSSDGVTTSLLVDRKSGRQFSIDESLAEGVINEQTVQLYRSGKMTIFELGDQLSGTSSGSRSRSSSFGASSVPASPQAGSKAPSVPWSDPTEETVPIGGILDLQKFEKISITEAIRRNLVDTITGQRLLEAQACTGGIINPATGGRCSIPEAVTQGLLDKYMADKLNQANKAYNGFEDLRTKAIFHTGQAMKKGLLFQEAGTRIFEVQYLTGGIIDSGKPERIQLDEAVEKGIVDNYTAKKIRDVNSHLKYLVCPKTKARITFKDALDRSMTDEETGVRLLEASGLTSRYSASTPSSGFGSRSGSRPGSRRGSFDATGTGTSSTFLSPSSYTSTSFSRR